MFDSFATLLQKVLLSYFGAALRTLKNSYEEKKSPTLSYSSDDISHSVRLLNPYNFDHGMRKQEVP